MREEELVAVCGVEMLGMTVLELVPDDDELLVIVCVVETDSNGLASPAAETSQQIAGSLVWGQ